MLIRLTGVPEHTDHRPALISFAPLSIPRARRMQTFAVLLFPMLLPLSLAAFFLALFVDRAAIPVVHWLISVSPLQIHSTAMAPDRHLSHLGLFRSGARVRRQADRMGKEAEDLALLCRILSRFTHQKR